MLRAPELLVAPVTLKSRVAPKRTIPQFWVLGVHRFGRATAQNYLGDLPDELFAQNLKRQVLCVEICCRHPSLGSEFLLAPLGREFNQITYFTVFFMITAGNIWTVSYLAIQAAQARGFDDAGRMYLSALRLV